MAGVACATGLDVVGDLSSGILHSPHRRGIVAMPFPLRCRGGPCTNRKKTQRVPQGALCFCTPALCLQEQAFDARSGYKKSPQAALESFFLLLR